MSVKFDAVESIETIAIRIALSLKFGKVTYVSVCIPSIAKGKLLYSVWPY